MFHILDKTYLEYNSDFKFGVDCIQIVNYQADEVGYDSEVGKLITGNVSRRLFYANTLEELLSSVRSHDYIFKHFIKRKGTNNSDKLIIYCDEQAYKDFSVKWLKTIMPKASVETLVQVYMLYRANALYNTRMATRDDVAQSKYIHYWMDRAEATLAFQHAHPFNITVNVKKFCSAEFQLATYLAHPVSMVGPILLEKALVLSERRLLEELDSVKVAIEQNLFNIDLLYPELGDVDFANIDLAAILKIKPELSFIGAKPFTAYANLKEMKADYDLEHVVRVCQEYLSWIDKGYELPIVLSDFITHHMSLPAPEAILKSDILSTNARGIPAYFGKLIEEGKVNGYLYSYIASLGSELYNSDITKHAEVKAKLEQLSIE